MKSAASLSLLQRAALVRLRALELGGHNDYYLVSSAESSSSLAAAGPVTTNMYVLAYGEMEGLRPGERLEVCGNTIQLVRTLAYCSGGEQQQRVTELDHITEELNSVGDIYGNVEYSSSSSSNKMNTSHRKGSSHPSEDVMWKLVQEEEEDKEGAARASLEAAAKRISPSSNEEVVVGRWQRASTLQSPSSSFTKQIARGSGEINGEQQDGDNDNDDDDDEGADELLIENGVSFATPEQAGLRGLRAARLAFMSSIERTANSLRDGHGKHHHRTSDERRSPLAVVDFNGIDFSFSQAAVQATVELGLHDEAQCHMSFVPLNNAAAEKVEKSLATFLRLVVDNNKRALSDPFALLQTRYFDVGAFTAYLELPAPQEGGGKQQQRRRSHTASSHNRRAELGNRQVCVQQLAKGLATMRKGGAMLVSIVPTPSSAAAMYASVKHTNRAEVAMEICAVAAAKSCVAEAISRTGRWGYITDEVLPHVDCPQGCAVSLVVTME